MAEAKLLLCVGAFVHLSLCVWMFFWPLTQIIKVVALRILYMFWTRDRREGSSLSFHFLWHSSTFSRLHQLLLPSDGFGMRTITCDHTSQEHEHRDFFLTWYLLQHAMHCHAWKQMSCLQRWLAVLHVSITPLFISIDKLLFILG